MKKLKNWTWVLIVVCIIQIGATMWSVVEHNYVLANGTEYRLEVSNKDLFDSFLRGGNYYQLNYVQRTTKFSNEKFYYNRTVYLVLEKSSSQPFDTIAYATHVKPKDRDYFIAKNPYNVSEFSNQIEYSLPFDSYFVNEKTIELKKGEESKKSSYVTIRVMGGKASLDKLYRNGIAI